VTPFAGPRETVELRERETGETTRAMRQYLHARLEKGLPVVGVWEDLLDRKKDRTREIESRRRDVLAKHGIDLVEPPGKPTTARNAEGKIETQRFRIRYRSCGHETEVPLGPFLQKLEKKDPRIGFDLCPDCRERAQGGERTAWLLDLAGAHGLILEGGRYRGAQERHRFSCAGRCEAGAYEATWDNLAVKGLRCRRCRAWQESHRPGAVEQLGGAPRSAYRSKTR
jgi:hypothetical protein